MFNELETSRQHFLEAWEAISKLENFHKNISHELTIRLDSNLNQLCASLYLIAPQYKATRKQAQSTDFSQEKPDGFDSMAKLLTEGLKLAVLFNSFYFLLRAFHDNLYCVLLELRRQKWHDGSSMAKAFSKPNSEITPGLKSSLPDYETWFFSMRELRNSMKSGAPSSGGSFDPLTGVYRLSYIVKPEGKKFLQNSRGITVGLVELVQAFEMSEKLIRYVERAVANSDGT